MATLTLNSVSLALPLYEHDGYERQAIDVGSLHELADGSTALDYVTTRWRFKLRWRGITGAERTAIRAQYTNALAGVVVFNVSWATSFNVIAEPNSWRESFIEDGTGTERYDCEMGLIEVS